MSIKENLIALTKSVRDRSKGICWNLTDTPSTVVDNAVANVLLKHWPHHSGNFHYPIPSLQKGKSPSTYYRSMRDLWDEDTEYGRLRYDALECLIRHSTELENLYETLKLRANL